MVRRRGATVAFGGFILLLAFGLWLTYAIGHRAGRGAACFEVAVHTPDQAGRTLSSVLLSRPGATYDYSFWGTQCTISIGWPTDGKLEGGRWAYFPDQARLCAVDAPAVRYFPASGQCP